MQVRLDGDWQWCSPVYADDIGASNRKCRNPSTGETALLVVNVRRNAASYLLQVVAQPHPPIILTNNTPFAVNIKQKVPQGFDVPAADVLLPGSEMGYFYDVVPLTENGLSKIGLKLAISYKDGNYNSSTRILDMTEIPAFELDALFALGPGGDQLSVIIFKVVVDDGITSIVFEADTDQNPIRILSETITQEVWENQRRVTLFNDYYGSVLLPTDRDNWTNPNPESTATSTPKMNPDYIEPSAKNWHWRGPWRPSTTAIDRVQPDKDGWVYAFNWSSTFQTNSSGKCYVRRRR